jgi:hypothetical protein
MAERVKRGRKLLIASIGVAAVSYVACGGDDSTATNSTVDGGTGGSGGSAGFIVGNLMPYPTDSGNTGGSGGASPADGSAGGTITDAGTEDAKPTDANNDQPFVFDRVVGNLIAPPPNDE